jgi:hypothetical protein
MGADGNPPLALTRAINNGLRPNKAGQHIAYLEIYEQDVVAADMQQVLKDGASRITKPSHR